jgi:hypothetical protein
MRAGISLTEIIRMCGVHIGEPSASVAPNHGYA